MGACREGQDAFWHLTSRYGDKRRVFTPKFWRGEYVWHDTFGVRFNRWIGCRLWGHAKLVKVSDPCETERWLCFKCNKSFSKSEAEEIIFKPGRGSK